MLASILDIDDPRWTDFVSTCPSATCFHHPSWSRLVAECYGYKAFVFALEDKGGRIKCGLPLIEVRRPFAERKWISLPFTDYCPLLTVEDSDRPQLVDELDRLRVSQAIRELEVRANIDDGRFHLLHAAVRHTLSVRPDDQETFETFHRSQVQRNIVKSQREGVDVRFAECSTDLTEVFYHLHAHTRRRLGAPVQPRRFFQLLWERIIARGLAFTLLAYARDLPVAGAVFLSWNRTLIYKYGASDPRAWGLRPNHALFWRAIQWGSENGYHTLDFGRTEADQEGLRSFKSGWGTTEERLEYSVLADRAPKESRQRLSRMMEPVIKRSPVWLARLVGEWAYKYAA